MFCHLLLVVSSHANNFSVVLRFQDKLYASDLLEPPNDNGDEFSFVCDPQSIENVHLKNLFAVKFQLSPLCWL